jgi:hypothetical protein
VSRDSSAKVGVEVERVSGPRPGQVPIRPVSADAASPGRLHRRHTGTVQAPASNRRMACGEMYTDSTPPLSRTVARTSPLGSDAVTFCVITAGELVAYRGRGLPHAVCAHLVRGPPVALEEIREVLELGGHPPAALSSCAPNVAND